MLIWLHVVALCALGLLLRVACTGAPAPPSAGSAGHAASRVHPAAHASWLALPLLAVCLIVIWSALRLF